jgi:hypothetical protein
MILEFCSHQIIAVMVSFLQRSGLLSGFPNFRNEFPNNFQDENAFLPMGQERLGIILTTENTKGFGEGPRLGERMDAKILNLPSKGDRSKTSVRSEGCCAVSELINPTRSSVRQSADTSFKGGFFLFQASV